MFDAAGKPAITYSFVRENRSATMTAGPYGLVLLRATFFRIDHFGFVENLVGFALGYADVHVH